MTTFQNEIMSIREPFKAPCLSMAPAKLHRPPRALQGCVRALVNRDISNWSLSDECRFNHLPALLTCRITFMVVGANHAVDVSNGMAGPYKVQGELGRAYFSGPRTKPSTSWSTEQTKSWTVMLYPDAFFIMTGVMPGNYVDLDAPLHQVLPPDWCEWAWQVVEAQDDENRLNLIHTFLIDQWRRASLSMANVETFMDWMSRLRSNVNTLGSSQSQRQFERMIKKWTGQNLRGLIAQSRAEGAFFHAVQGLRSSELQWRSVAALAGYADQSHFCREALKVAGFSPDVLKRGMLSDENFWIYRMWAWASAKI